ncbi:MAG: adenylate/guanylate cyclase domain-containing protein, partial [Alphaproteobacteria bacterium]
MAEERVQRRLAAILAADVVGYSRLMDVDEETTLRTLRAYRKIIDGLVTSHSGRVFGTAGDSVIAEFTSPVEAVRCAVEIQQTLEKSNADLPKDSLMCFRIGVNLGDVMVNGDDLLGDGVNLASRLEGLANTGGICISGTVYDQVAGKIAQAFEFMGEQTLKNIEEPVRAYRVFTDQGLSETPA